MLSYDETGRLTEIVSNTLKNNVANYLSNYRMINDYVSIESANVIDLAINVDVVQFVTIVLVFALTLTPELR